MFFYNISIHLSKIDSYIFSETISSSLFFNIFMVLISPNNIKNIINVRIALF